MEIIYIDRLFFTNLLADYLLLLCAARLCCLQLKRLRYFFAALLGAGYAVSIFLPGLSFLAAPGWKLVFGVLLGLIAYGRERRALGCTGVFLVLSAALGGALWALELSFGGIRLDVKLLVLSFLLAYGALRLIFAIAAGRSDKRKLSVQIQLLGRSCAFTAIADSGNCLSDPLTGSAVAVACPHALSPLFGPAGSLLEIKDPVELLSAASAYPELKGRLRLVSFSALGGGGLLPVFRPDRLLIEGKEDRERLIAISPQAAGPGFEGIV